MERGAGVRSQTKRSVMIGEGYERKRKEGGEQVRERHTSRTQ